MESGRLSCPSLQAKELGNTPRQFSYPSLQRTLKSALKIKPKEITITTTMESRRLSHPLLQAKELGNTPRQFSYPSLQRTLDRDASFRLSNNTQTQAYGLRRTHLSDEFERNPSKATEFLQNWMETSNNAEWNFPASSVGEGTRHKKTRSVPNCAGDTREAGESQIPPAEICSMENLSRGKTVNRSYSLGSAGKLEDMLVDDKESSELNVAALEVHDFAFIRRSNSTWTYAILANKPDENYLRFVVNKTGSTKTIPREHWAKLVRCLKISANNEGSSPTLDNREDAIIHTIDECTPANTVRQLKKLKSELTDSESES